MIRLADALKEMKELIQKIAACENVEKRKSFSLKSDLDHIVDLKNQKQELREEIDELQRKLKSLKSSDLVQNRGPNWHDIWVKMKKMMYE